MNELQAIPFHHDTVYLVDHDGFPHIPVRPIVENIGVDWKGQYVKLTTQKKWSTVVMITTVAGDGKQREMLCLPLRKLTAFLYSIDADKVRPDLKEKVEMYQEECDEVLWNYWTKGVAVNQRFDADSIMVPKDEYISLLKAKVSLLEHGRRRKSRPLTDEDKAEILALVASGMTQGAVATAVGRSTATVSCLVNFSRREVQA